MDKSLANLLDERAQLDRKMAALVDSLADMTEGVARKQVSGRIEALGREREALEIRISEMEALATQQELSDSEFDILRDMLTSFAQSIDGLGLEQQRAAVKTLVRKVVWDGEKAHMILFGAEGDIDFDSLMPLDEADDDDAVSEHPPCEGNVADMARSANGCRLSLPLQQWPDRK